ncbi:MAG: hypothetical protein ACI8WB_003516 [Phenylobacterium sp.]|jgi:hypothetical protein
MKLRLKTQPALTSFAIFAQRLLSSIQSTFTISFGLKNLQLV